MTLNEIAYNLLNLVRGGKSNQDETISIEQIKFNIKHYRAMFIRRDFAKNNVISRHSEQDLGCVELERVNASQCCNLPVTYSVFRSKTKIPKTVRLNFKEALTYIGDVTGTTTIPLVDSHSIQWLPYDKYTKGRYKSYMIADYLYIYNADGIDTVNVRGIFEDPDEVALYSQCGEQDPLTGEYFTPCYDSAKDPFPISMDMISLINQGITSGELTLITSTFNDTTNDRAQDKPTAPAPNNN